MTTGVPRTAADLLQPSRQGRARYGPSQKAGADRLPAEVKDRIKAMMADCATTVAIRKATGAGMSAIFRIWNEMAEADGD